QAADVVLIDVRVGQQVHHHGRDVAPGGNAVALDQFRGGAAVPAGHDHLGGAQIDGGVHAHLHAGDMEHRHRYQLHAVVLAVAPHRWINDGGHGAVMGMYTAL